jgi:hypothetical protein
VDPAQVLAELGPELAAVVLSRPANALRFLPLVRQLVPQAVLVYDTVDLHFVRLLREGEATDASHISRLALTMKAMELAIASDVDLTLAVSEPERQLLLAEHPGLDVAVVSNIHPTLPPPPGPDGRSGLLLVGNFQHPPNVDSAQYMVEEILPLIQERAPGTVLRIVGSRMPPDVQQLAGPCVEVLGWVADLTELHNTSRVLVAPLRFGAGVKGKVGDALRRGLPVVTTSVGAEGMDLVDATHLLVADSAASTAEGVLRLLADDELWRRLSSAGAEHIASRLSPDAAKQALEDALLRLGVLSG